jgi:glutathione S-transferase
VSDLTLVIGNKNYSSWSLRPWLALKQAGIAFDEVRIPLYEPRSKSALLEHSPAGKVPVLHDGDVTVWDSLAICEYLAERFPHNNLWPQDAGARAQARAVSAEMHSGFPDLRSRMPMNLRSSHPGRGRDDAVNADIARVVALWSDCRERHAARGPFLFGTFSIADAMYAPVATRFITYGVELPPLCAQYVEQLRALPALQEWYAAARIETEFIARAEPYV